MEIIGMGEKAISIAERLKTPILLAHGNVDNITSVKGSEAFAKFTPADMVDLKIWDGLRHETHNEHNKEEVIGHYVNWLVEKLT